ncbi:MAG: hypothetical protein R2798_05485 [Chitinophagales bacterium]|nr:hypothetical protein [Bacteroidota bacterium]MCB9042627.1 hypothetical protein [Chitinophagales bacterium]
MNFIAHYSLDRYAKNDAYIMGALFPDLLRMYHKNLRVKASSNPQTAFEKGINRHYKADAVFHNLPLFKKINHTLIEKLKTLPQSPKYLFFVAHVLSELYLDFTLIQLEPTIVSDCDKHIDKRNIDWESPVLQPILPHKEGLNAFIDSIKAKRFLHAYASIAGVTQTLANVYTSVIGIAVSPIFKQKIPHFLLAQHTVLQDQLLRLFKETAQKVNVEQ